MKKKYLALVLAACMTASLAACGSTAADTSAPAATTEEAKAAAQTKVNQAQQKVNELQQKQQEAKQAEQNAKQELDNSKKTLDTDKQNATTAAQDANQAAEEVKKLEAQDKELEQQHRNKENELDQIESKYMKGNSHGSRIGDLKAKKQHKENLLKEVQNQKSFGQLFSGAGGILATSATAAAGLIAGAAIIKKGNPFG